VKSALMIWGGWKGHEPKECVEAVAPVIEQEGFNVVIADSLDLLCDADRMQSFDVVVPCWTMGDMSGEQCKGLASAVASGIGLAGWHGGMGDAFRSNTQFQFIVGGQFVAHPGGQVEYEVNMVKPDDPIVAGIPNFTIKSEQYYMHVDPGNEVIADTTVSAEATGMPWVGGTVMPVVWKRNWDKGRVFYSSLGHVAREFEIPEVMEITKRGILWAAR